MGGAVSDTKLLEEQRLMCLDACKQAEAARATARIAISHLIAVLQISNVYNQPWLQAQKHVMDQEEHRTAAKKWLTSIGV